MAAATLADINSTLLSIKRDTAVTAKRLSGKGSSAEEAREGLKERTKARDIIAKPTAPKAPSKNKGGGIGGFFSGLLAKGIDWLKWFAAIGLGAFFFKEIKEFITAAFEPWKKAILKWWDEKKDGIGKAWEGVLDASGFNKLMEGSQALWDDNIKPFFEWFYPENNKFIAWFKNAGKSLDNWLNDSFLGDEWKGIKNFLFGEDIHGEFGEKGKKGGIFAGVKEYARNLTSAIGKFGESLGLLDEKGNVTGMGMVAGIGTLATLFTFIGPIKLIKAAFTGSAILAKAGIKTVAGAMGWVISSFAKLGGLVLGFVGDAAIWGAKGATKLAGKGLAAAMKGAAAGFLTLATKVKDGGFLQNALLGLGQGATALGTKLTPKVVKSAASAVPAVVSTAAPAAATKIGAKGFIARIFGGMPAFVGGIIVPLLAVAAVGAAVYGLWKMAEGSRTEHQKSVVNAAKENNVLTEKMYAKIRADAIAKIDKGKTKKQIIAAGAGSFEDFARLQLGDAYTGLTEAAAGGEESAKQVMTKVAQGYNSKVAAREAVVESRTDEAAYDLLNKTMLNSQRRSVAMLGSDSQTKKSIKSMFKAGVLEWVSKEGNFPSNMRKFQNNLSEFMKNPKNIGKEITKKDLLNFGMRVKKGTFKLGLADPQNIMRAGSVNTGAITNMRGLVGAANQMYKGSSGAIDFSSSSMRREYGTELAKINEIDRQAAVAGAVSRAQDKGGKPGNVTIMDNSSKVSNAATTVVAAPKQLWWQRNMPEWLQ